MSKVAQYLQEHVVGEVITSTDAREYFSTDASILKITPQIVVYPRAENDVRKIARFSWQLAERGRLVPLTARGLGTDQSGGALGQGVMMVFPAHMNKILTLDSNKGFVAVQPGINYGKLQQTLLTHGQFLPPYPSSIEYSTIGGAVANNAGGEKSIKYGVTKDFARELRVVLANGEVITTKRISKKELNQKKGLPNFEGEIYRSIDNILSDNEKLIESRDLGLIKNSAGYNIWSVKGNDGSIDLTPLFIGSQGTLGIITEIVLDTESYSPSTTLLVAHFDDLTKATEAVVKIKDLSPSALELVDRNLLDFLNRHNPNLIKNVISEPYPNIVLLIEFDDIAQRKQKKLSKKARKILEQLSIKVSVTKDAHEQEDFWKIRHSAAAIYWQDINNKKALPIIEDATVPPEKLSEYILGAYNIMQLNGLESAIWGHAGNGNMHIMPFLDLSQLGDRQKVFKIMEEYYQMVISLGGSTTGQHNDGRIRAPYLPKLYGREIYEIFKKIKQVCDPYGTLNPGVKIDVDIKDVQQHIRNEYSLQHLFDHMPRS